MDLSLIPIEDILNELDNRFDANVVLTCKNRNNENDIYEFHQDGGHFTVLGMCEQMAFCLKNQQEQQNTDGFIED